MILETVILQPGWEFEVVRGGFTLINRVGFGYVTIDWSKRGFRSGYSSHGSLTSTKKYTGRGWRAELTKDAVAWLSKGRP